MIAREPADRHQGLGRRSMLRGVTVVPVLALLGGCTGRAGARSATGSAAVGAQQSLDAAAVDRARQRSAALLASAQSVSAPEIAADHRAHLAALGVTSPSTAASGASPGSSGATSSAQSGAELDGAREAVADVTQISGGSAVSAPVAVLLTRIAASRAAHADLLGADVPDPLTAKGPPSPSPTASPSESASPSPSPSGLDDSAAAQTAREALTRLVADTHAAVYGYGVVAGRVGQVDAARAEEDWSRHRSGRDVYITALLGLGGRVPAALSAYQVGAVTDAAAAADLAVRIETALTTRLLATLAQVEPAMRGMLVGDVVSSVLRTRHWGGTVPALPGSP